jgi:hypothetical protein
MTQTEWTQEKLAEVREVAIALMERSKTDEDFKKNVQENPIQTLEEAGLPREAVGNFLRDAQIFDPEDAPDVDGYVTICVGSVIVG